MQREKKKEEEENWFCNYPLMSDIQQFERAISRKNLKRKEE